MVDTALGPEMERDHQEYCGIVGELDEYHLAVDVDLFSFPDEPNSCRLGREARELPGLPMPHQAWAERLRALHLKPPEEK